VIAALVSLWTGAGWAQTLWVVGVTVESEGTRPDVVDDRIAAAQGMDLWGFSEVQDAIWATLLARAAAQGGSRATAIVGRSSPSFSSPMMASSVRGTVYSRRASAWRRSSARSQCWSSRCRNDQHGSRRQAMVMRRTMAVRRGEWVQPHLRQVRLDMFASRREMNQEGRKTHERA
jgi:hypothetical protein